MKIFRFGKFFDYNETYGDSSWNREQFFKAAALFATCLHLGYEEKLSYSLSFMFVTNESLPETLYEEKYRILLDKIMDRVEKA